MVELTENRIPEMTGEPIHHKKIIDGVRSEERRLLRFLRKLQKSPKSQANIYIVHDQVNCCILSGETWNQTIMRKVDKWMAEGKLSSDVNFRTEG